MYKWKTFPQIEKQLVAYHYKPYYNRSDEETITSELCPTCNTGLSYIGYKNIHSYKAFMYCGSCPYWEEY